MVLMIYHSDLFYFWSVDTCFHVSDHNVYTSLQVADGVVCVNQHECVHAGSVNMYVQEHNIHISL